MKIEKYNMNMKRYKETKKEERKLREEYKETTDKISEELYQEFETKWLDFLLDVFDLLKEEGKDFSIESGSFTFTFNLSWRVIRVFKTKEMSPFYINSMLDVKNKRTGWSVVRNMYFNPETNDFEKWQENMEELIEKNMDIQTDIEHKLEEKADRAVVKIKKAIEKIKQKIIHIKQKEEV